MKKIVLLGSTGSIGANALQLAADFPDRFQVVGLTAGSNNDKLLAQIRRFRPRSAALADEAAADRLRRQCRSRPDLRGLKIEILSGMDGLVRVATLDEADIVVSAIATGVVPYKELDVPDPIAVAADRAGLGWMASLIKLGAIAGLSSVILVMLLGQSRIFWTMSRDGLLPQFVNKIHPRFRPGPIRSRLPARDRSCAARARSRNCSSLMTSPSCVASKRCVANASHTPACCCSDGLRYFPSGARRHRFITCIRLPKPRSLATTSGGLACSKW